MTKFELQKLIVSLTFCLICINGFSQNQNKKNLSVCQDPQAINNNFSAEHLFKIYQSILSWEIGIKKMMCYTKEDENWYCASHIGVDEVEVTKDISGELLRYQRMTNLLDSDHYIVSQFDIVIPVYHKDNPIAFTLLGELGADEEMYEKIRFITTITNNVNDK